MIISEENVDLLPTIRERKLIKALLKDIEEINHNLSLKSPNLKIEWIDTHTEYSPERVDPCPDYYGMYRVWRGEEILGVEMDLDTLDISLCLLSNFVVND